MKQPVFQKCIRCLTNWVFRENAALFGGLCRECWCREHHPEIYFEDDDVFF